MPARNSALFPYTTLFRSQAGLQSNPLQVAAMRLNRWFLASENLPGISSAQNQRSEEHTSELQSRLHIVCRLLREKKKHWAPDSRYPDAASVPTFGPPRPK